jgi:hypothetical protein
MLNLTSDRLDYGDQLRAPPGYALDRGIATTYSLDLETLVAASLALNLDQTLEGDLSGERIALLESLDRLQKCLVVFYQRGNLKLPANFNRLFMLLEPMLVPAVAIEGPQGAYASFHPKVWVLRFRPLDEKQPVRLRLLVLSRNLCFDRSWDLAVCLDGVELRRGGNGDPRLQDFLRALPAHGRHRDVVDDLCASLSAVEWTLPDAFKARATEMAMLPGGPGRAGADADVPFTLDEEIDELLVVSPFVDADANSLLQELGRRTVGRKTLISRADTLDAIGADELQSWDVRSLSDRVVDGEEQLQKEEPAQQALHAKLIVAQVGGRAIWHIGSANMTHAAFGKTGSSPRPRNVEFMLRLCGDNKRVGPAKILEEWSASNVFEQHHFAEPCDEPAERSASVRELIYALTSAHWALNAIEGADGYFSITLSIVPLPAVPAGFEVRVGLLSRAAPKDLAASLSWDRLKLTDVSPFVPVEVLCTVSQVSHCFAIQASFTTDLFERRQQALFREIVDTPDKLLRYLGLLLDVGATKATWLRADGQGDEADVFGLDGRGGLYEQLLRAASRAPDRLARVTQVFERMRREKVPIPDGLVELVGGFSHFNRAGRR